MSVSDESAPGKRRKHRRLTDQEWKRARAQYEHSESRISQAQVAEIFGVALRTVEARAAKEGWKRGSSLVTLARDEINRTAEAAIKEEAKTAVKDAVKEMMDELGPFIAREKAQQVYRSLQRAKAHQERIDRISGGYTVTDKDGEPVEVPLSPKDMSYIGAAEDRFDTMIRRNLGMNDGTSPAGGALSLNILTNQAVVQVLGVPAATP